MTQEKNAQIPIMILSDAPTAGTGFARITNALASNIATKMPDLFRVCTFGYGGMASRKLPYHPYTMEGLHDWIIPTLPETWKDWAGDEQGIVMTIWDISRLNWLSQPEQFLEKTGEDQIMRQWLIKRPFKLWGYVPVDGSGPNDKWTYPLARCLQGFDRLIAYGQFGEDVIRRTMGDNNAESKHITNLPHGVDTQIFHEMSRNLSRLLFFQNTGAQTGRMLLGTAKVSDPIQEDEVLIGICATNQFRKNWALGIKAAAIISRDRKVRLWLHTDKLEKEWSIPSLLVDYGLLEKSFITCDFLSDEVMAGCYSACDLMFGIGPEGFGLPNAEALACQTPVITGSYGGSADFVPKEMQVDPIGLECRHIYAIERPVYRAEDWAAKASEWIGKRTSLDPRYAWSNLWQEWETYLREAVK